MPAIAQAPEPEVKTGREALAIAALGLLLFTLGFWHQPFIEFEARFALFAQEMWRHGPTLFPTAYGEPYPDYPATSTWLIWLVSQPFGAITKLSAILPTALAAALNLLVTYRLLARFSRQWALLGVGFQLLTVTFLTEARSISLDQMLATVTALSFHVAYSACQDHRYKRLLWLPLLLAVGFSIRGPLGVVLPAGVVCSYFLLSAQWRRLVVFSAVASLVLVVCWLALLGLAAHFYGEEFRQSVVHMQVAGRLEAGDSHRHWYYFTSSFGNYALAYPIAALVAAALAAERVRGGAGRGEVGCFLLFLLGWIAVIIAGLSIPDAKKARYLLPIVPAISALAAYPLVFDFSAQRSRWLNRLGAILEKLLLIFPALAAIGFGVAVHRAHKHALAVHVADTWVFAMLLAYQLGAFAAHWRAPRPLRPIGVSGFAALTVWTLNLLVVEPALLQLHDARSFVRQVETLRKQKPADLVFFRVGKDAAAIKYLVNVDYDLRPTFIADPAAVNELPSKAYLIAEDSQLPALRSVGRLAGIQPVLHDRFDHHLYTVFYFDDAAGTD